ncbi:MAG: hypothetical protein Q8918_01865 [Bacteroidota bacterium]|nr:hypothetical protein [Bacteroidota bacterium]
MKSWLFLFLLVPVLCFSQKEKGLGFQVGGGYLFYPGSSADVHISAYDANPLKSGFTLELTADKPVNSFLLLGPGVSFNSFSDLGAPYIPLFADIRVIGTGKFKLYSFLDPGYGIFHRHVAYIMTGSPEQTASQSGGFYIAYGFGVIYKRVYLQAKYNWLRFTSDLPDGSGGKSSKAYGVGGISFGVRLP